MWYDLAIRKTDDALTAEVHIPPGSRWFDGHFPGAPVLPGIAQLGMVFDLIRHAFQEPVRVVEVSRVRFKQIVGPDDRLVVTVEPRPVRPGSYVFRITRGNELVCSGTMVVASADSTDT
jgi:3-hydroxyacyl-[acyl-carrier-protein] dehydratase